MYGVATMMSGIFMSGAASRGRPWYSVHPKNTIKTIRMYTGVL